MIWLADVTATVLAIGSQKIGPDGKGFPLAVDLHTTLLGNQKDGEIKAEARNNVLYFCITLNSKLIYNCEYLIKPYMVKI